MISTLIDHNKGLIRPNGRMIIITLMCQNGFEHADWFSSFTDRPQAIRLILTFKWHFTTLGHQAQLSHY